MIYAVALFAVANSLMLTNLTGYQLFMFRGSLGNASIYLYKAIERVTHSLSGIYCEALSDV